MKLIELFFIALFALLMLFAPACDVQMSTANIHEAWMSFDAEGENRTTTFTQDSTFYAQVDLRNAPPETKVKAVWIAVEVEGEEPGTEIAQYELPTSSNVINFKLTLDSLWPAGDYRVDIYLNDKLERTLEFAVAAPPDIEEEE